MKGSVTWKYTWVSGVLMSKLVAAYQMDGPVCTYISVALLQGVWHLLVICVKTFLYCKQNRYFLYWCLALDAVYGISYTFSIQSTPWWHSEHMLLICCCTFYCTVGPPECSVALQATVLTDTSITVMLMWTNCEGAEPSAVMLRWLPGHNSCNVRYISSLMML